MKESNRPATGPHKDGGWSSTLIRLVFLVLLIASVNIGVKGLVDTLALQFYPSHLKLVEWAVVIGVAAYVFLMATPFVPGIEIGLALMMLLGWPGIVLVYICTLLALSISFLIGGYIPAEWLGALLRWLRLSRAEELLKAFDATPPERRLDLVARNASTKMIPAVTRHRYLVLGALLNLPGNTVIGGAGGIAMLAGMSRLYTFPKYLALISAAALPGPIIVTLSSLLT